MNEKENNFSETVDNQIPDGVQYDIFSENTNESLIEAENMNRDYLNHIYKEDMSCLNKEVRMTRMQYLREIDELNSYFEAEKKKFKKLLIFISVVLIIFLGVGLWAIHEWYVLWQTYKALYSAVVFYGRVSATGKELSGFLMMTTFYGTIGIASSLFGICQFCFFGHGYRKKIKELERYRRLARDSIETRKKEAMLLGHYDSLK